MPFKQTTGSRAQVMHGTAKKTSGGLTKSQLKYNKQGKIVSKKASALAKKNNRLVKAGYNNNSNSEVFFSNMLNNTELHIACKSGQADKVEQLIRDIENTYKNFLRMFKVSLVDIRFFSTCVIYYQN